jgi:hypothetical protein
MVIKLDLLEAIGKEKFKLKLGENYSDSGQKWSFWDKNFAHKVKTIVHQIFF